VPTATTTPAPLWAVALRRRIRLLAGLTLAYNVVEAVVALAAGTADGSGALIAFGLDSVVEVAAALAVLWQFAADDHEQREAVARWVIGGAFLALAAHVTGQSVQALVGDADAGTSAVGIALAAVSAVVMPGLAIAQRRAGRALGSPTAVAGGTQTMVCAGLSVVLLVGLVANATLGWAWLDPVAALAIAAVAAREGVQVLRGEGCCAPSALAGDGCAGPCDCSAA
jgi:divalent metal cation (Fe/Co/Zn/Cd) transporter